MPSLKARILLTNKCENHCWYCKVEKSNKYMSLETIDCIIKKLNEYYSTGYYSRLNIGLTGGDPFKHPNFIEIVKHIRSTFPKANMLAEVTPNTPINSINEFVKYKGSITVSLNEEPIDLIINHCKNLQKTSRFMLLNIVLTNYNMDRIESIINECLKYKISPKITMLYDPRSYDDKTRSKIIPTIEKIGNILMKCNTYTYKEFLFAFFGFQKLRETYCGYGKNFMMFDVDGYVSRCTCETDEPVCHVSDNNILEKIQNINKKEFKIPYPEECKKCEFLQNCWGGCVYSNRYGGYCNEQKAILSVAKKLQEYKT